MNEKQKVMETLEKLNIPFKIYEHPPLPTIELAREYWKDIEANHCKNLFFRNHKGNRHYLVILDWLHPLEIHDLEKKLKQGKISFASQERLDKYLHVKAGSVSAFSLINDINNHVYVFIDENLKKSDKISFHPNINTASVVISFRDFERYLAWCGNKYEYINLYQGIEHS